MTRCGNCGTLCVSVKILKKYGIFVKDVGTVTVENFPMLECHNCRSQWINGRGDKLIEEATEKMRAEAAGAEGVEG